MFKILLRVALAYAAYRISREFVQSVPDIESGPDPAGMYQRAPPNRAEVVAWRREAPGWQGWRTKRVNIHSCCIHSNAELFR